MIKKGAVSNFFYSNIDDEISALEETAKDLIKKVYVTAGSVPTEDVLHTTLLQNSQIY